MNSATPSQVTPFMVAPFIDLQDRDAKNGIATIYYYTSLPQKRNRIKILKLILDNLHKPSMRTTYMSSVATQKVTTTTITITKKKKLEITIKSIPKETYTIS